MAALFKKGSPVSSKVLLFALVVAIVAGIGLATSGSPTGFLGIDLIAPDISVSFAPKVAPGQTHLITVSATDDSGVSEINIFVDNVLVDSCTNTPCIYSAAYDTIGTHSVYITARDSSPSRNQKISAVQDFTVAEPEVTMELAAGTVTSSTIELFWTEHPGHSTVPGNYYIVFMNDAPRFYPTRASATVFGLAPSTTYYVYVVAIEKDTGTFLGKSNTISVATPLSE